MSRLTHHLATFSFALIAFSGAALGELQVSGQINRMIASMDNGADSEVQHLDNNGTGTRLRVKGERDAGNGLKVGFYWETQYQSNSSLNADIRTADGTAGEEQDDFRNDGLIARHRDLWIKGSFGKVSLGQGNGAANGITEMEYTGTTFLTGSANPEDIWNSLTFANSGGLEVGEVYDGLDALSRNDRLRFDTPEFAGFTLSVDTGNGGKTEKAVRFNSNLGNGGKIKFGFGTWDENKANRFVSKGQAGSIAYLHGSGLNAAFAFGKSEEIYEDSNVEVFVKPKSQMLILGYKKGSHAVSVRRGETKDKRAGVTAESTEIGYVNKYLKEADLYLGYQIFETDVAGADDLTILFAGARVKF